MTRTVSQCETPAALLEALEAVRIREVSSRE